MIKKVFVIATGNVDSQGDILLPSSLKMPETGTLKVLDHFDAAKKPLGLITEIKQVGNEVVATGMFYDDPSGLTPAIGFQVIKSHENAHGGRTFDEIKLMCVGLTPAPNSDSLIKPIE